MHRCRLGQRPTPPFRRRLLRAAQLGLWAAGATSCYAHVFRPQRVTALMYHSVGDDPRWVAPGNRLPVRTFERQMRFLAKHRHVLAIGQLVALVQDRRPLPVGAVLLTFDDGYVDILDTVAPILQRYQLPAVLYLATAYLDREENQWADQLYVMLNATEARTLILQDHLFDLRDPIRQSDAYHHASRLLTSAVAEQRTMLLQSIRRQLSPRADPPRCTLRWDEVGKLHHNYPTITLGVHTHEHVDLSLLSEEQALDEVRRGIDRYQEELHILPQHFSFPSSRVNASARLRLHELGLITAMTGEDVMDTRQIDLMDLRRIEPLGATTLLKYWTSGAHPYLSRMLFGRA